MRAYNIVREFIRKDCYVHVITTGQTSASEIEQLDDLGEVVVHAKSSDYRIFRRRKNSNSTKAYYQKGWKRIFVRILNSFPFNIIVGEGGFLFIMDAYRKAKMNISEEGPNLVFTTFRPYASHIVGFLLKRNHPSITWIADFRDPHVDPLYKNTIFNGFQHWCNRQILSSADLITAVSSGIADLFKRYNKNTYRLTNGFSLDAIPNQTKSQTNKFRIGYTGSMFADERRPDLLLEAVSELIREGELSADKIEIVYAGPHSAYWEDIILQYELTDVFLDMGNLSMKDARKLQAENQINILLTSSHKKVKGIFTGKLFEYLAVSKPIIVIINGPKDEEYEEFMDEVNAGLVVYHQDNPKEIKEFILNIFKQWNTTGRIEHQMNVSNWKKYSWPRIMDEFYDYLRKERII